MSELEMDELMFFAGHCERFALVVGNDLELRTFTISKRSSPRIPQVEDAFISFHVEHSFQEVVCRVDTSISNLSIGHLVNLIGRRCICEDHLLSGRYQ